MNIEATVPLLAGPGSALHKSSHFTDLKSSCDISLLKRYSNYTYASRDEPNWVRGVGCLIYSPAQMNRGGLASFRLGESLVSGLSILKPNNAAHIDLLAAFLSIDLSNFV